MDSVDKILREYPYISEDIRKEQSGLNKYIILQQEARNPLKAQVLTGMPHNSGVNDQTYNAVEKIIDRYQEEINKYTAKINKLLDLKKWLDKAFTELSEDERRIVFQYYDEQLSIREISRLRKKSREQTKNMIEFAVNKIKRIIL